MATYTWNFKERKNGDRTEHYYFSGNWEICIEVNSKEGYIKNTHRSRNVEGFTPTSGKVLPRSGLPAYVAQKANEVRGI